MNKSRYKLYKQGKKWVITLISATTLGVSGYYIESNNIEVSAQSFSTVSYSDNVNNYYKSIAYSYADNIKKYASMINDVLSQANKIPFQSSEMADESGKIITLMNLTSLSASNAYDNASMNAQLNDSFKNSAISANSSAASQASSAFYQSRQYLSEMKSMTINHFNSNTEYLFNNKKIDSQMSIANAYISDFNKLDEKTSISKKVNAANLQSLNSKYTSNINSAANNITSLVSGANSYYASLSSNYPEFYDYSKSIKSSIMASYSAASSSYASLASSYSDKLSQEISYVSSANNKINDAKSNLASKKKKFKIIQKTKNSKKISVARKSLLNAEKKFNDAKSLLNNRS